MMKTPLHISLFLFLALVLGSCTRNHGDIGMWFGTWHVESITADEQPVNDAEGDYFFQFQSKVFRVSQVSGHETLVESFGTWAEDADNGKMTITFPDPGVYYIEMRGLEEHNDFTVTMASSRDVTLVKTDAAGITYAYHLKKQP